MAKVETHYRACNLCEAMCGIKITHEGKQILSIKGDENDPFSQGYICPKATALQDLYEDPDRLTKPMIKTASGWQEVDWPQAFDAAAAGLSKVQQQYGQDTVASYFGNPNVHNTGGMVFGSFLMNALKSKSRYTATSVDQLPHHIVSYHLFGHQLQIPVPDIDRTDFFLVFGANPVVSNGSIMTAPNIKQRFKAIKARSGKIVVIDPRKTETAALATEHHFIRPGTDALLLLAMIQVMFVEDKIRPGRLASFTSGLDEIQQYVTPYTPERVASVTGIAADQIRSLVNEFCAERRAVCYGRMGVSVQQFGLLSQYLIMLINILTGRLDTEGGMMFTTPAFNVMGQTSPGYMSDRRSRVRGLPSFSSELPVSTLAEEILVPGEQQIRGLLTVAGNPVLSTPNGAQLNKALQQLDFMVSVDFYLNETTQHADVILPPVSPLEREHFDVIFNSLAVRNTAKYARAVFAPEPGAKHDWQIYFELSKRLVAARDVKVPLSKKLVSFLAEKMGLELPIDFVLRNGPYGGGWNIFKGLTLKRLLQQPHGVDLGPLKSTLPQNLTHKDKQIHLHLAFYMADLKRLEEAFFQTASDDSVSLLIGRRDLRTNNSWMHNSKRLVKGKQRCTILIHPEHALRIGLVPGQQIKVSNGGRHITLLAEITDTIMPGVVSIPHGWGHGADNTKLSVANAHAGVSVNDITDENRVDELSGNAVLNGVPVVLVPVEAEVDGLVVNESANVDELPRQKVYAK